MTLPYIRTTLWCVLIAVALLVLLFRAPLTVFALEGEVKSTHEARQGTLDSHDRIRLVVIGHEEFSGDFSIDGEGLMHLPLIGVLEVKGLTVREAELLIIDELKPDFLINPRISLHVLKRLAAAEEKAGTLEAVQEPQLKNAVSPSTENGKLQEVTVERDNARTAHSELTAVQEQNKPQAPSIQDAISSASNADEELLLTGAELIRESQKRLQLAGFNPGPVDGVLGLRTRQAMNSFQRAEGIEPSGVLDDPTLVALDLRAPPSIEQAKTPPVNVSILQRILPQFRLLLAILIGIAALALWFSGWRTLRASQGR